MKGEKRLYGVKWPEEVSDLDVELYCLRADPRKENEGGRLTSFEHYKNAVDIIFNNKDSIRRHVWSDESIRLATEMLGNRDPKMFLGIAGNSSSGKSDTLGLFCIVLYLSDPCNTLCILTSTTLEMAKLRVWKAVREYWNQVERFFKSKGMSVPGNAVHSKGRIRGLDMAGEYSDASGLVLVAADKQKGEEATSKVMGAKAPGGKGALLILGADELPDLAANLLTVAYTNLINNPMFWMYGLGNPNLKLDPHGRFCEPLNGWESVSDKPMEWETERGRVIRFESEQSSRIRQEDDFSQEDIENGKTTDFFWQPSREVIEAAAKQYGRTSRYFARMYEAMWSNSKAPNAIYSENELMGAASQEEPQWDNSQHIVPVSGMDSSYTSGGDRSVAVWGLCGKVNGITHLHITGMSILSISSKKDLAPSHQVACEWRDQCIQRGVRPRAAGFDNSGSGVTFGHIIEMEWSPEVRKINFGGAPSERTHRLDGVSKEEFANRVSELWVQPKEYIRGDRNEDGEFQSQISGLNASMIEELVSRQYSDQGGQGAKLKVEVKKVMKKRTGKSPDIADATVALIDVCIQNGYLDSQEEKKILRRVNRRWSKDRKRMKFKTRRGRNLAF